MKSNERTATKAKGSYALNQRMMGSLQVGLYMSVMMSVHVQFVALLKIPCTLVATVSLSTVL